jgi:Dolichyl-phosphate-mannose-protein mannosyltransferase
VPLDAAPDARQAAAAPVADRAGLRRAAGPLLAAAVLVVSAALNLSAGREKSVTFDEVAHLTGGYSYWTLNDYRMHGENGNLPQRLEALPLLASGLSFPSTNQPAWWQSQLLAIGQQFFFACANDVDVMLARARAMVVLFAAGLGALVYAWSRRLFGPAGGLVSVILYGFCPTILAHGGLATSDLIASFFFTAALWSVWKAWHRLSPLTLLVSGLTLAGLFLSKMSAFAVLPAGAVLLAIRVAADRPLELAWPGGGSLIHGRLPRAGLLLLAACAQTAIVWLSIWAAFGFRFQAFADAQPGRDVLPVPASWEQPGAVVDGLRFARDHRLLPEGYLQGFASMWMAARERAAFFNGDYGTKGWVLFFPYCLLVKTPLSLFGLLALAAAGACRPRRFDGPGPWALLYKTAPLTVFLAVYWAFALASHLNIGQRHLLPTYPAMFVLAGAAAFWLRPLARVPSLLVAGLLTAFVVDSVLTWPNYLSYFNTVAGGPRNAYRHLVDSSLDWGQDLPGLKKWLQKQGLDSPTTTPVYLSYFGTADPEYYGIHATRLPSFLEFKPHHFGPLTGGVYCVSATMLQGVVEGSYCPGPWTGDYETRYRAVTAILERLAATRDGPAARQDLLRKTGFSSPGEVLSVFDQLRFGRLCAFLRQREPDDEVGYSILIYRLTDDDIKRALSPSTAVRVSQVQ